MSRLRTLASQSPAIVISVIALAFSLGGGAGWAATTAGSHPAAAKVVWHKLSLRNGWSAAPAYKSGNPEYTIIDGVIHLNGVLEYKPNVSDATPPAVIGVLPKGFRPTHTLWLPVFNYASANSADLSIAPNGKVSVIGGADAAYFTSLAGVSFPRGS